MEYGDYQLRYAAGMYWLLNTKQRGLHYIRPLSLNECGAHLWQMLSAGADKPELVNSLCAEYGLERAEALSDVEDFIKQLNAYCAGPIDSGIKF